MPYWQAWFRLHRSRQWSQGEPQAVQLSECLALCTALRWYEPDIQDTFLDIVQDLDEVFIKHVVEKQAAKLAKAAKPAVVTR